MMGMLLPLRHIGGVALLTLCWLVLQSMPGEAASWPSSAWLLNEQESIAVAQHKIVTHIASVADKGYGRDVKAVLQVNAPATLILSLVRDFSSLPEYVPHLEKTKVLASTSDGALVNYTLALPFGVIKRYRLQLLFDKQTAYLKMSWKLVPWLGLRPEDTLVSTVGFWQLEPMPQGDMTTLYYQVTTDPGSVPLGLGWIVDYLTTQTIVELLEKTRERAENQWSEKKQHIH